MAKEKSPSIRFDPANPETAPFVGRRRNIQQLCAGLEDGRSFQLYGPPRVGKTCMLRHVEAKLASNPRSPLPVHVECDRLMSRHRNVVEAVLKATAEALQQRTGAQIPIDLYRRVMDLDGGEALRTGLNDLQSWGLQFRAPHRVALLLDGLHRLGSGLTAELANTLYGIVNNKEAQVVWCGRERLRHELRDDVSPLASLFTQHIPLGSLTVDETRVLVREAKQHATTIEHGFARTLHQMTNGHPYRLQYYLHAMLSNGYRPTVQALHRVHTTDTIEQLNEILTARGSAVAQEKVTQQPTVFVSYSHENEQEKKQLVTHLRVLESSGIAVTWVDDLLLPGSDWEQEIFDRIDAADVAVLMISAPFLKPGGFILKTELPRILERHGRGELHVLPIIARPCDWESHDQISRLTLKPKNATPLWREGVTQPDEELTGVVQQVRKLPPVVTK